MTTEVLNPQEFGIEEKQANEILGNLPQIKGEREAEELAKAPIKEQLLQWVNMFEIPLPKVANETSLEIAKKFNAFKEWSIKEIEKL